MNYSIVDLVVGGNKLMNTAPRTDLSSAKMSFAIKNERRKAALHDIPILEDPN
jgi:hypothetical protein